ncbi:MAG: GNAT family N-acetyltransferase [Colwellia sp.]|nr:GNAT family N-acetyltransferase [Colwellia sp.]
MSYSVSRVKWEQAAPLLKNIREKVFVCEWRIPKHLEFDKNDRSAFHMLICDDITQEPIATGRILATGEISRIAVVMSFRRFDMDKVVLQGLFKIAKELNLDEVFIHSPLDTVDYFAKHHFFTVGSVFMEAGMPKQRMACGINQAIDNSALSKYYLIH